MAGIISVLIFGANSHGGEILAEKNGYSLEVEEVDGGRGSYAVATLKTPEGREVFRQVVGLGADLSRRLA